MVIFALCHFKYVGGGIIFGNYWFLNNKTKRTNLISPLMYMFGIGFSWNGQDVHLTDSDLEVRKQYKWKHQGDRWTGKPENDQKFFR